VGVAFLDCDGGCSVPKLTNTGRVGLVNPWAQLAKQEAHRTCVGLARTVHIHTVYDRIFGHLPAKKTVYTPYLYGSGQP